MPKKTNNKVLDLSHFKHHLIPSAAGGVVAYLLSSVVLLGLGVFATVWLGSMISHKLHHK